VGAADRLDASDAQFVDVVHTAGKWVGNDDILGHVDFYPNDGRGKCEWLKIEWLLTENSMIINWKLSDY
jgi:hypothetical protein